MLEVMSKLLQKKEIVINSVSRNIIVSQSSEQGSDRKIAFYQS